TGPRPRRANDRAAGVSDSLWLDPIPDVFRAQAVDALEASDIVGFLCKASNAHSLDLVRFNARRLLDLGLYERALLQALTAPRINNSRCPVDGLGYLVRLADPGKLRAAGDPLPGRAPFTAYRGVAGRTSARRVKGLSWTFSPLCAAWFARRSADLFSLAD